MEEIQVSERLRAKDHGVPQFVLRHRDQAPMTLCFDQLPMRYAHTLMIPQYRTSDYRQRTRVN